LYHVYNRGNRKKRIFYNEADYEVFLGLLQRYQWKFKISVVGYCLMVNHYHLLIKLGEKTHVSKFMQGLGISYTLYINKRYRLVGHVFQGRYQVKEIIGNASTRRIIEYFRNNPVKDGMVRDPIHYRWMQIQSDMI